MATDPVFTNAPRTGIGQISTANTGRDGSGTIGDVMLGGANGSRIDRVRIVATGTTTAGIVRLYLDDGVSVRLIREVLVTAITASAGTEVFQTEVKFPEGLFLPTVSWDLQASTHKAETFNVIAYGGDF